MTDARAPLSEAQRREIARLSMALTREIDQAKCAAIIARLQELDPVEEKS